VPSLFALSISDAVARRLLLLGLALCCLSQAKAEPRVELTAAPAWKGWTRPGRTTEIDVRLSADSAVRASLDVVAARQSTGATVELQPGRVARLQIAVSSAAAVDVEARAPSAPPVRRGVSLALSESPLLGVAVASDERVALDGFHALALAADDLPRNGSAYASVDALIVDAPTLAALDQRQLAALVTYAADCGRLVLINTDQRVRRLLEDAGGCGGRFTMQAESLAEATSMLTASLATSLPAVLSPGSIGELARPSPAAWNAVAVSLAVYFAAAVLALVFIPSLPAIVLTSALAIVGTLALLQGMSPRSQLIVWSEGESGTQLARYQAVQRFPGLVRERVRVPLPPQLGAAAQSCEPGQTMHYEVDATSGRATFAEFETRLFRQVSTHSNFVEELNRFSPTLLDVFECGGAAICFEGQTIALGQTPPPADLSRLVEWLRANTNQNVFSTDSLARLAPELGLAVRATASGVLAINLAQDSRDYILWFRPEKVQTVTWAGRHAKNETTVDGQVFLSPRQSFEAWKEHVQLMAAPWRVLEIEAAHEIRLHVTDVRLKVFNELRVRAADLARLNAELTRSNDDLDSFAYVASHDLKEPLRGIHNYSVFLLEDYADKLDEEGQSKLQTLVRLSQRMESLIESLLQISRVGRQDIVISEYNLNVLVAEVIDLLAPRLEQTGTTLSVPQPLPTLRCDPVRLREVYNNLLTNAMRYNDKSEKHVEIGVVPTDMLSPKGLVSSKDFSIMYVKDNGIGIDSRHHESIFRIFKRLHSQDKYGGGTGIGLAIVKKMVEKHDGDLWIDSTPGHGTTFYFTISNAL